MCTCVVKKRGKDERTYEIGRFPFCKIVEGKPLKF